METIYLCIVIFLFVLAVFDLIVGVSNDAVNFLNSAVGAKAASFKTMLFIAGVGVFIGAAMSNGMMDIARHGIYQPQHFYFAEIMCILLAVMLTDVVLLDVFNTMGMPTSTTVSMVFELLGGTFALALIKAHSNDAIGLGDLINTDKALSVIMGIFLSVAIAFFFGMLVQWLARVIFTFNYKKKMKYSIALFGGIATTAIIYFMLIKGLKDSSFMTSEAKQWVQDNTAMLIGCFFVFFTILMQILHWLKVNVFKVVVLLGTFALALAFAGNDLVNFIGVPLAGYSSFIDYTTNGMAAGPNDFLMSSLLGPAKTPWYFLIGAGAIMVYALCTSKKAHNVIKTSVDLSRHRTVIKSHKRRFVDPGYVFSCWSLYFSIVKLNCKKPDLFTVNALTVKIIPTPIHFCSSMCISFAVCFCDRSCVHVVMLFDFFHIQICTANFRICNRIDCLQIPIYKRIPYRSVHPISKLFRIRDLQCRIIL